MAAKSKTIKLVTVVGARPQFIKAAVVSRAVAEHNRGSEVRVRELIVHTGQHYDPRMSQWFFDELGIPAPACNLEIGSGGHGAQTGRMLEAVESVLVDEKPHGVLVYGDTNSTLAGALAASKLLIPVAHVEAGLRSFNAAMPEEQNRILTDHLSAILFAPTTESRANLKREGITKGVYRVGDVMCDSARHFLALAKTPPFDEPYILATVHRAENTGTDAAIKSMLAALDALGRRYGTVYLPAHPRIRDRAERLAAGLEHLRILPPLTYTETMAAMKFARLVATDSGGIQKEALFARTPCLTLRAETEWVETVKLGANALVGADRSAILAAAERFEALGFKVPAPPRGLYGAGGVGRRIVEVLARKFA